ncbi:hypothetical protein EV363DRAFT_1249187 [Boletus edulis]|uniref:Uncharacterized protein n=1 Tax=Boletus edulis BED1 TaxID=1328754 RepID=A0AAD4C5P8_BOLED|nr:hypothetical protein EV363DRAFT_1249187 [Boletus edulis]KAF8449477.1 hypothetical protein L210DRAFT_3757117 [Boletus edulis BED1]
MRNQGCEGIRAHHRGREGHTLSGRGLAPTRKEPNESGLAGKSSSRTRCHIPVLVAGCSHWSLAILMKQKAHCATESSNPRARMQ